MLAGDLALDADGGGRGGAGLVRSALLCSSSSNPIAEVPEEALELGMLAGDPALGADRGGRGGVGLVSTGSAATTIARRSATQRRPHKNQGL